MKMKKFIKPVKPWYELSESGDIIMIKSKVVSGSFINDREVEAKTDYIFYSNGNVLLKSYRNNCLYSVSLVKGSDYLNGISKQTPAKAY